MLPSCVGMCAGCRDGPLPASLKPGVSVCAGCCEGLRILPASRKPACTSGAHGGGVRVCNAVSPADPPARCASSDAPVCASSGRAHSVHAHVPLARHCKWPSTSVKPARPRTNVVCARQCPHRGGDTCERKCSTALFSRVASDHLEAAVPVEDVFFDSVSPYAACGSLPIRIA